MILSVIIVKGFVIMLFISLETRDCIYDIVQNVREKFNVKISWVYLPELEKIYRVIFVRLKKQMKKYYRQQQSVNGLELQFAFTF